MLEFVETAAAREASGVRMVVSAVVPSPWSEAAKGVFRLAKLPVLAVRAMPRDQALVEWTGVDNVPVVLHGKEPARTSWSQIVGLAARLAPGTVLPADPMVRAEAMGLIELIAGEDGLGWNGRLAMIEASLASDGARGFAPPVAAYLAKRYGYSAAIAQGLRARVMAQLATLAARLGARAYFGGEHPNAVDAYLATFLTPLVALTEADCPRLAPPLRTAFAAAAEAFGALVAPELLAVRTRMFAHHLPFPIEI
ncbi:MAG: glutathione S-transferase C-terminal domain-containing protein [Kofleriaceae bacterium]